MTYDIARLKEHVLFPVLGSSATTSNAFLGLSEFLLTASLHRHKRADCITFTRYPKINDEIS